MTVQKNTEEKLCSPQWQEVELTFVSSLAIDNPYINRDAWVDFIHEDGTKICRPIFWDGENRFIVRFASDKSSGIWSWMAFDKHNDPGIQGKSGSLMACPNNSLVQTRFTKHGFWHIPKSGRNLVHADGTPCLLCADTAWALPWRATIEQAEIYAENRSKKGYNATLLMTVQPDMKIKGPRSRTENFGFDVGFEDLPNGTLQELNPEYFQTFDKLTDILISYGIAPVYQPVFHGYGWKGGGTAGNVVSSEDYSRYCKYLVARYGARPAIWLVGADGPLTDTHVINQLDQAGQTIEQWDAYQHPTGIHYAPCALNNTHQEKDWLDFQWCQTGHNGEHIPERLADMWRNQPVKAVANGEPTYENMGKTGRASGWWQGHEAWCNLTAGGTMGVVYGAGSLWQWRLSLNEPWPDTWCMAPGADWRIALDFEGSYYPGIAAKIFDGLPFEGMKPDCCCTFGRRGLLVPGKLFVLYLPTGGGVDIRSPEVPRTYKVFDPKTGSILKEGSLKTEAIADVQTGNNGEPRVIVFS